MIDNIRIMATDPESLVSAVRAFLNRVREANLTLNGEWCSLSSSAIIERASEETQIFLGEEFMRHDGVFCRVRNTKKTIEKLEKSLNLFEAFCRDNRVPYTRRNFCSLVGLLLFALHTVALSPCRFFLMQRATAVIGAMSGSWDDPLKFVSESVAKEIHHAAALIIANDAVPLPQPVRPSYDFRDYDAIVICDASGAGWGASIRLTSTGEIFNIKEGWQYRGALHAGINVGSSATAEPLAARRPYQWRSGCSQSGT